MKFNSKFIHSVIKKEKLVNSLLFRSAGNRLSEMKKLVKRNRFFVFSLLGVIVIAYLRYQKGINQQDNYILYAKGFSDGFESLPYVESRLLPGFPFLIHIVSLFVKNYLLSAYFLVITLFGVNYFLLKKIVKSELSVIPLIFPPVLLNAATTIAVESLTVFFILLTYFLVERKKYDAASFVSGAGFVVRPILSIAFPSLIFSLLVIKRKKITLLSAILFLVPIVTLALFNDRFFGEFSPLYQIETYKNAAPHGTGVGILQIVPDLVRSIKWRQYNIFLSGLFYLALYGYMVVSSFKKIMIEKNISSMFIFITIAAIGVYTLSYSFIPFIENFGRYIAPTIPLYWIFFHNKFERKSLFIIGFLISVVIVFV